jgi:hypothetical protein
MQPGRFSMRDPRLLELARARALPGKEAVALTEALRAIIEAVRQHREAHLCDCIGAGL